MNICYCGTAAGYPHRDECPYPLFRGTPTDELRWEEARQRRAEARARIVEGHSTNQARIDAEARERVEAA